ncbi:hypothetical protein EDD21DRAFT_421975 [Dissophora ornata]|nr:hypothetical protein EDD21DRAFT_421975 [Dissophora ornata]
MQTPKDYQPSDQVKELGKIEEVTCWQLPSTFFAETETSQWLPEKFYDAGYVDISDFLKSLVVLSDKRRLSFGARSFCAELLSYLVSPNGRAFLRCLAALRSISIEECVFQSETILQAMRSVNNKDYKDSQDSRAPSAASLLQQRDGKGKVTAQEGVDKVLDGIDKVLGGNEAPDDDLYDVSGEDAQSPEPVLKPRKRSSAIPLARNRNKKQKSTPPAGHIPAPLDRYSDPTMASRIQVSVSTQIK